VVNKKISIDFEKIGKNFSSLIETAMGVSVNAQLNPNSDYVEAIRRILAVSIIRFIKPWLWPDFTFYLSSLGKCFQKRLKVLHSFTDSVSHKMKINIQIIEKI
jgi:hypothetical protein